MNGNAHGFFFSFIFAYYRSQNIYVVADNQKKKKAGKVLLDSLSTGEQKGNLRLIILAHELNTSAQS